MKLEYKPSSGMVWRASPAQGKTLYRETEGTAGKAAFPEETREMCNTMHKTRLQIPRNTTISSVVAKNNKSHEKTTYAFTKGLHVFTRLCLEQHISIISLCQVRRYDPITQ